MKLFLAVEATVLCLVGLSFILKLVPRNRWLGVITSRTKADPAIWYRANREFGIVVLAIGVLAWVAFALPALRVNPVAFAALFLATATAFYTVIRRYAA
ncbi:SdpI family protein [Pseudoluteimonas lycopersici]